MLAVLGGETSASEVARRHGVSAPAVAAKYVEARPAQLFGSLEYKHLDRGPIDDGDALAVEVNRFRQIYNTIRSHQALHDRAPRGAYLAGR